MTWLNPFNPYFPATGPYFANRRKEQDFFRQGLLQGLHPSGPGPWNVAVLGQWGIGKTSLLRRFVEITEAFDPPALAVSLTVTSAIADWTAFTRALLSRIHTEIRRRQGWSEKVRQELLRWEPSIGFGPVQATRRSPDGSPDLYRELERLWRGYFADRVAGMVLFLDDAHVLLARDEGALLTLRGIFQDLQGIGARYPLVITGPEDMFEAVRDLAEPVTRFFERMLLEPFTPEEAAEAVRAPLRAAKVPLEVDDDAIAVLHRLTAGHPFFIAFAMRDLLRECEASGTKRLTASHVERARPGIVEHLARERFAVEWRSATSAEREVLAALAKRTGDAPLTRIVGRSRAALLARLVKKGLVIRTGRGEYAPYHPLFAEFVGAQAAREDGGT